MPQLCTSCQKAPAKIQITDLEGGSVVGHQFLCQACAESSGVVSSKHSLKLTPDVLEELLGSVKGPKTRKRGGTPGQTCPGCGLTAQDFKSRGRLGCPRCYEVFHEALIPLLERVHDASSHCGSYPRPRSGRPERQSTDALRRQLDDAVRDERYEDAARLRDALRRAEEAPEPPREQES